MKGEKQKGIGQRVIGKRKWVARKKEKGIGRQRTSDWKVTKEGGELFCRSLTSLKRPFDHGGGVNDEGKMMKGKWIMGKGKRVKGKRG